MKKIRVKIYKEWQGTLAEPLRHDLWKWGINLDDTYESDKNITNWYENINNIWYSVSYTDGLPR